MVIGMASDRISTIELKDFSISFSPPKNVLGPVNLKFRAGKTYLLTGPTGSGKSTLLKFLKGIVPLFYPALITGEILVNHSSLSIEEFWSYRTSFAYISQDPSLQVIGSTVEEDLAFGLENLAIPSDEIHNRIRSFAKLLNIQYLLTRSSSELSGGELSLVSLASVLILEPQVVLLDEITAYLDVKSRKNVLRLLASLKGDNRILIIVSHRIHDFLPVVDEVVTFDKGSVQYHGSSKDFIKDNFPFISSNLRLEELFRVGVPFCTRFGTENVFITTQQLIASIRGVLK